MRVKIVYVVAIVLAGSLITASTSVSASEFCDSISTIAKEAKSGFAKYRNGSDGTGDYSSTIELPGSYWCYIEKSDEKSFVCRWHPSSEDELEEETETFADGIQECYPDAVKRTKSSSRGTYYIFRLDNKIRLHVASRSAGKYIIMYITYDK